MGCMLRRLPILRALLPRRVPADCAALSCPSLTCSISQLSFYILAHELAKRSLTMPESPRFSCLALGSFHCVARVNC